MSRLLKNYSNKITQAFKGINVHGGVDLVGTTGSNSLTDYITAHSTGTVVEVCNTCNATYATGGSYGNYVKIKHSNGMYTLYAHLKYGSISVNKGDTVSEGQVIGYMGNTGHSFGAHLHFEVRDISDKRIDPTPYLDADLGEEEVNPYPVPTRSICYIAGNTMKGNDVAWVQWNLNRKGYKGKDGLLITIDKSFGPNCDYAIRQFSKDNGITSMPQNVGPMCREALKK